MKKQVKPSQHSRPLPQIDFLEAEEFAAHLLAGELRMTSVGAQNCYAVDVKDREFYAKDLPQALRAIT